MTLLMQALAAVAVAVAVALWARTHGARVSLASAVPMVAAVVAAFVVAGNIWNADKGFVQTRKADAKLRTQDAFLVSGAAAGANTGFVEWLNAVLPPKATYALVTPRSGRDEATYQWATYRLFPRVAQLDPRRASFLVFDGVTPVAAGYSRSAFSRVMTFGKGLSIAERRQ